MKKYLVLALFVIFTNLVYAQSIKSHFDQEKWVEYIEGDMPLVISVPHGGRIIAENLSIRDCKGAVTGVDGNTIELAKAIQAYFQLNYHKTPHIILSHIARKNVDQNRELENGATCGYKENEKPWYSFHNYIDSAIHLAQEKSNKVMYIDLHGHGHKNQRLEVGYNLTTADLNNLLKGTFNSTKSSLNNLIQSEPRLNLKDLTFGNNSFGTYLVNNGVAATPSKQDLVPLDSEKFFSGGDNTRRYTGKNYPHVFGLQVECNSLSRQKQNRAKTAKAIAESIVQFLKEYGNYKF